GSSQLKVATRDLGTNLSASGATKSLIYWMNNPKTETNLVLLAVADLFPGYFALVMATGIISIACQFLEMRSLALVLLIINLLAYVILSLLFLARLLFFFSRVKDDLNN